MFQQWQATTFYNNYCKGQKKQLQSTGKYFIAYKFAEIINLRCPFIQIQFSTWSLGGDFGNLRLKENCLRNVYKQVTSTKNIQINGSQRQRTNFLVTCRFFSKKKKLRNELDFLTQLVIKKGF